jgi:hypothetical protein
VPEPGPVKTVSGDDARRLAAEVARLRSELAAAQAREPERVEVPVLTPGELAAIEQHIAELRGMAGSLEIALSRAVQAPRAAPAAPVKVAVTAAPEPRRPEDAGDGGGAAGEPLVLKDIHRAFLAVLAQFPDGRTKKQAAVLAGYSPKSSGVDGALSALRSAGLIDRGQPMRITAEGIDALGDQYEPPPTGRGLVDYWMSRLGKAESAILQVLLDAWPRMLTRNEMAEAAGYSVKSSGFDGAIARLRALQLADGQGGLRAVDELAEQAAAALLPGSDRG